MGEESSDEEGQELQPTLILGAIGGDGGSGDGGSGGGVVDEDATTVDEQSGDGDGAGADLDTATSKDWSHDRGDEVQPTLILDTQILDSPDFGPDTQILDEKPAFLEGNPVFLEDHGRSRSKNLGSIRARSLRKSAMAAYERLVSKLELQGGRGEIENSAKFVLEWGRKQERRIVLVEPAAAIAMNGGGAGWAASASTPISQTLKNTTFLPALCSNNKKSTENREKKQDDGSGSPRLQESSLDKVRKALFEPGKDQGEGQRQHCPIQPLTAIVAPVRELSFLNSQDPGEESQAVALEALEKLVAINGEFSQEAQLSEFDVEPKKTNVLSSRIAQLQRKDPSSVYDFVVSQEDPLMTGALANVAGAAAKVDEQGLDIAKETKEVEKVDEESKPVDKSGFDEHKSCATRGSVSPTEHGSKKRKAPTPKSNNARGKRRKKTASPRLAHAVALIVAEADPQTPKDINLPLLEGAPKNSKSSARKRKIEDEKLIIADDTPRRSRRRPVKLLFSHSLGKETIEEKKKVAKKLKFQVVETATECTHFVTDRFLRTANMLEVLAAGKPVVDLAWLESCSVAGCAVDEKRFIILDSKKEKELGFSMQTTYTAAQQKLLLQGMKVHVTPKTKPDMVDAVVKAAGGEIVKKNEATGDCLVVSCDEDRKYCVPLIKKGVPIYSTEFLFSGVVTYHLDYSKNLLFDSPD